MSPQSPIGAARVRTGDNKPAYVTTTALRLMNSQSTSVSCTRVTQVVLPVQAQPRGRIQQIDHASIRALAGRRTPPALPRRTSLGHPGSTEGRGGAPGIVKPSATDARRRAAS